MHTNCETVRFAHAHGHLRGSQSMDSAVARASTPAAVLFEDGLGVRRHILDQATNETLEMLSLRGELTAVPSFEFALRERVSRLANFRHAYYGRVRRVDRLTDQTSSLAIVRGSQGGSRQSEHRRLSRRVPASVSRTLRRE